MVPSCGHTEKMLVFSCTCLCRAQVCEKRVCLKERQHIYSMHAVLTITSLATVFQSNYSKGMNLFSFINPE